MKDDQQSAPAAHWRRRSRGTPIPRDHAARQGDITSLAFQTLGKDRAIEFLNSDSPLLGGRPLALATESQAGRLRVEAELERMRERPTDTSSSEISSGISTSAASER